MPKDAHRHGRRKKRGPVAGRHRPRRDGVCDPAKKRVTLRDRRWLGLPLVLDSDTRPNHARLKSGPHPMHVGDELEEHPERELESNALALVDVTLPSPSFL